MRIALLTIHSANSYGGCLQCLASQLVLSKYGSIVLIDYKSSSLKNTMQLLRFGRSLRSILHVAKDVFRIFPRWRLLNKFKSFMGEYYCLSIECNNFSDLQRLNESFDFFICGSDQIWNPAVIGYFDTHYLLDFVISKPRISFSSSAGSYVFNKAEGEVFKKSIEGFSKISVREKDLAARIFDITGRSDVEHTLDPTLLLNKQEWLDVMNIKNKSLNEDYIFIYTLKKDRLVYEAIAYIAKKLDLKVIAVDQDPFLRYRVDCHVRDADPREFLTLLANAKFVITNSFHGTAFSVNFGVPFISIKPESGTNRVRGFLDEFGLGGRLIESMDDIQAALSCEIDYKGVQRGLDVKRASTFSFLEGALEKS